ncbi:hypothetical protein GCM10028805_01600 [Spirosoma harenae]
MKSILLLFSAILILSGCQIDPVSSVDDGTLPGQFRLQIDPIRCSMPTTQRLNIQATGGATYRFTYDRFGVGSYSLTGITATKTSSTSYELSLDNQVIGHYAFEELRSLEGTQKRWVLIIMHNAGKPDGLEFMGTKE